VSALTGDEDSALVIEVGSECEEHRLESDGEVVAELEHLAACHRAVRAEHSFEFVMRNNNMTGKEVTHPLLGRSVEGYEVPLGMTQKQMADLVRDSESPTSRIVLLAYIDDAFIAVASIATARGDGDRHGADADASPGTEACLAAPEVACDLIPDCEQATLELVLIPSCSNLVRPPHPVFGCRSQPHQKSVPVSSDGTVSASVASSRR
jgi:hypothetical protein